MNDAGKLLFCPSTALSMNFSIFCTVCCAGRVGLLDVISVFQPLQLGCNPNVVLECHYGHSCLILKDDHWWGYLHWQIKSKT